MKRIELSGVGQHPSATWNIICDFDGTIAPFDVTDAVLTRYAAPEWEPLEEDWKAGRITARECMEKQVALITVPRAEFDRYIDTVPIDAGFTDFYAKSAQHGFPMQVVSDGMDYPIRRILDRQGLQRLSVVANHLVFSGQDSHTLEFPHGHAGCPSGVCKCKVAERSRRKTLLIGDGLSDCCLAARADFVFAKRGKSLHRQCEENGYAHALYDNFFDIRDQFDAWVYARTAEERGRHVA